MESRVQPPPSTARLVRIAAARPGRARFVRACLMRLKRVHARPIRSWVGWVRSVGAGCSRAWSVGTQMVRTTFMRAWLRRPIVRLAAEYLAVLAVVAGAILGWAGYIQIGGNIDTVEQGEVYRSAQLSVDRLAGLVAEKHIKTVINLTGVHPHEPWYRLETRVLARDRVRLIDLPMSATHRPSPELLAKLITSLQTAERPLLIHCNSGSDRTGLASALYELIVKGAPIGEARRQLSFYWGHFPWLGSGTIAMDATFDAVVAARTGSGH
ncbi:MAG: tyrosine-protein phosphatase [Ancalomicrobiaceae bacterium]|nr:tyrosine-protein phosphatase [Ancalomicrobiaceae bacterium]